jgi:hypothetical protein
MVVSKVEITRDFDRIKQEAALGKGIEEAEKLGS